jgi:O-antigen ligase
MGLSDRPGKWAGAPVWGVVVSAFLGFMLLTGGISIPSSMMIYLHTALSACLILAGLWRLQQKGFPTALAMVGAVLAILSLLLVLLQLLPLPPEIWSHLPSRDLAAHNFELLGLPLPWMPLSLSPEGTRLAGIAMLPGLACFIAVLTTSPRQLLLPCLTVLLCAIVSVLFAVVQYSQGPESSFYLYDVSVGAGTGTFNNRNNFAAQLYTALPFIGIVVAIVRSQWRAPALLSGLFGLLFAGVILAGLAVSGSRSGIIFAMLAVFCAVILASGGLAGSRLSAAGYGLVGLLVGLFVIGQASMIGLLRIVASDPLNEYRGVISDGSLRLLSENFVSGSGFGSFVPLYQAHEQPAEMLGNFVNHAHNDWLELAIEGGLPAIALELSFLAWFVFAAVRVWRYGQGGKTAMLQRAASLIIPLLLAHSCLEFPLRTPALLSLFGFLCGLLCLPPDVATSTKSSKNSTRKPPTVGNPELRPFRRPETGFRSTMGSSLQ